MNPVWLISLGTVLVGGAAVAALLRSTLEEVTLLSAEVRRQRDVADALRGLGGQLAALEASLLRR